MTFGLLKYLIPILGAAAYVGSKGADVLPAWAKKLEKTGYKTVVDPNTGLMGLTETHTPTLGSRVVGGVGEVLNDIRSGVNAVVAPTIDLAGRLVQSAGTTGGALVDTVAQLPQQTASIFNTDAKRQQYGNSPSDAAASMISGLGKVGGLGVSMTGNAIGGELQNIGNRLLMARMADDLHKRSVAATKDYYGVSPAASRLVENEMISGRAKQ